MNAERFEVKIRGKTVSVSSCEIQKCRVVSTGRFIKMAQIFDENLLEAANLPEPQDVVEQLKMNGTIPADVFSFTRCRSEYNHEYPFLFEWDNIAVVNIQSFDAWWRSLSHYARRDVNRAAKRGIVVRLVDLNEELVYGIKKIYDETPVRQGRRFWHYKKDIRAVEAMNSTYSDRSHLIGAYLASELVGFLRYVRVDQSGVMVQVIAMEKYRDKLPVNALIRHAVLLCEQQGLRELTYGKLYYGLNRGSSLSAFKTRNGFTEKRVRRYFVPLTWRGKIGIRVGMHVGFWDNMPASVTSVLRKSRQLAFDLLPKSSKPL